MVTSDVLTGDGSLLAAVEAANQNPGHDTIQFSEGLQIDLTSGDPAFQRGVVHLTESVTIDGADSTVFSTPAWISTAGDINNDSTIDNPKTIIASPAMRFLQIGNSRPDNSGIEVTVRNLNASQLNNFAIAEENASLLVENVTISDLRSITPQQDPFIDGNFTDLTIRNTVISGSKTFADVVFVGDSFYAFVGGIAGSGNLIMENVTMRDNYSAGAVLWTGGEAKIVSSQFVESGGIQTFDTNMTIVNSAFDFGISSDEGENSIVAGGGAVIDLIASSVSTKFHGSQPNNNGQPLLAAGGQINLKGSAIYGGLAGSDLGTLDGLAYYATLGGSFSANGYSWVSPVDDQDADALKALFQNSNLLTQAPGLSPDLLADYPQSISPVIGTPEFPGTLIDVIPDSDPGGQNVLINPIDGSPIVVDVLGNPRVDGNGSRNIGAVQFNLAPHLNLNASESNSATLSWNRIPDPETGPITGYEVFFRETNSASWWTVPVGNPEVTGFTVSGLTNGTAYEFEIAAINEVGAGPSSNRVRVTPYGDIDAPQPTASPSVTNVLLSWEVPDSGGYSISGYGIYYRLAGADTWTYFGSTTDPSATVTGLQRDTDYEFGVKTVTTTGQFSSSLGTTTATTLSGIVNGLIDVKPGSYPNSINLKSKGVLPIAVLTTSPDDGESEDFDATAILTDTIALNDIAIEPVHYAYEDLDGDGDTDLILHFSMENIVGDGVLDANSVDVVLSADFREGPAWSPDFIASDSVRIVNGKGGGALSSSDTFSSLRRYDVNGDGHISPLDALLVIRDINEGQNTPERDVNGDGYTSPLDALLVVRLLNTPAVTRNLSPLFSGGEATRDPAGDARSYEDMLWQYRLWLEDEDELLRWT